LNDENYAVNYLKFATDKSWTPKDALAVEHWSLLFWSVANFIGSLVGNLLPMENYLDIVDFALTAMFIYMIVMQIRNKLTILVSFISGDRKSTRLNSSHVSISYAVFCLKRKAY